MSGAIALVGSGAFSSAVESIDRDLLAATGRARPRVAVLPPSRARGAHDAYERTAELGRQHFAALGAEVEPISVRSRADADDPGHAQAIGEADLVYISGGSAGFLWRTLAGSAIESALWHAHERGAVVAGCSGGAVLLGGLRLGVCRRLGWPVGWQRGLGLVPVVVVTANYNAAPEPVRLAFILRAPAGTAVLGIDGETALVGRDGSWQVQGAGRVTVWRGRRRTRHRDGDVIRLNGAGREDGDA